MNTFDMDKLKPGDVVLCDHHGNGKLVLELVIIRREPTRRDSVRHLIAARCVEGVVYEEKLRLRYEDANLITFVRTLTVEERLTHPLHCVRSMVL